MPLQRRLPKRGFRSPFRKVYEIVSLKKISCWEGDSALDPEGMLGCGMICRLGAGVKVLADGSLTRPVHIKAHRFSQEARRKIESVGGVAETI
jgi:large subunit ribosomal protein L15